MIIGNQESKKRLQSYLEQHAAKDTGQASFFLLYGPGNIGKSAIAQELSQTYLGSFFQGGFLHIKDFSTILNKKHLIKIEEKTDSEEYKTLYNDYHYQDLGVREINGWLQQSSFGGSKILLIENIDRMTREATNAFLKTCEEPLNKRVIIATTSNKSKLLETTISRAISIPFFSLSREEIETYIYNKGISIESKELKELLITMAMGRPGTLDSFYQQISKDTQLQKDMEKIMTLLPKPGYILEKYKILDKYRTQGILEQFLDGRIAYCVDHHIGQTANRLKVKKLFQQNIKKEHLILYGLLG